jgi:hypothetical protein
MMTLLRSLLAVLRSFLRTQRDVAIENLALRHQIGVLKRTVGKRRLRLGPVLFQYSAAPGSCRFLDGSCPPGPMHGDAATLVGVNTLVFQLCVSAVAG